MERAPPSVARASAPQLPRPARGKIQTLLPHIAPVVIVTTRLTRLAESARLAAHTKASIAVAALELEERLQASKDYAIAAKQQKAAVAAAKREKANADWLAAQLASNPPLAPAATHLFAKQHDYPPQATITSESTPNPRREGGDVSPFKKLRGNLGDQPTTPNPNPPPHPAVVAPNSGVSSPPIVPNTSAEPCVAQPSYEKASAPTVEDDQLRPKVPYPDYKRDQAETRGLATHLTTLDDQGALEYLLGEKHITK